MAIDEAKVSLREGNHGFGAVIIRNDEVVAMAHDTENTQQDPTAHAELTAIRIAAGKLGRRLDRCIILSTHEPCPMCATAILWSGMSTVVFGFSNKEAIQQGRRRINISCQELFDLAGKAVKVIPGAMRAECALLYNRKVRDCVAQLRDADDQQIDLLAQRLSEKRLAWFNALQQSRAHPDASPLECAYQVFLAKLSIAAKEAPIVERGTKQIVIHSRNFCPTLEACKILQLDTRHVCARLTEAPMDKLLKQVDPRLSFSRNYTSIRPYSAHCEETITLRG